MSERRGFLVEGRVQGVGFRWWTRRWAMDLGLCGDVLNRPDGSVEVQAAGTTEQLEALEEALRKGPPMSRVTAVHTIPAAGAVPARGFLIEGR